mgnify:FL=1
MAKRKEPDDDDDVFDGVVKKPNLARYARTLSWTVTTADTADDDDLETNCGIGQMEMDKKTLDYIWKLFNVLDQNGDGTIDASDFLAADEQAMYYSTVLRDMLEKVKPEENGGTAGQIRKVDWINLFRNMIHDMALPSFQFK